MSEGLLTGEEVEAVALWLAGKNNNLKNQNGNSTLVFVC